jgi:hypothetical protein
VTTRCRLVALSPDETPIDDRRRALRGARRERYGGLRRLPPQLKTFAAALAPFWGKTMPRIGDGT